MGYNIVHRQKGCHLNLSSDPDYQYMDVTKSVICKLAHWFEPGFVSGFIAAKMDIQPFTYIYKVLLVTVLNKDAFWGKAPATYVVDRDHKRCLYQLRSNNHGAIPLFPMISCETNTQVSDFQ